MAINNLGQMHNTLKNYKYGTTTQLSRYSQALLSKYGITGAIQCISHVSVGNLKPT